MSVSDDPRDPGSVPPAGELDELASALLDGVATPAEAARAADPDVAARLRSFTRVRDAVAAPVPPVDDDARERGIAAALAAWDAGDDLTARRADRERRVRRSIDWARPLGIAAAVLAALAVGGLAIRGIDREDDDSGDAATAALEEQEATADGADAGADSEAGGGMTYEDSTVMSSPVAQLGDYGSLDELVVDAVGAVGQQRAGAGTGPTDDMGDDDGAGEAPTATGESAPDVPPIAAPGGCAATTGGDGAIGSTRAFLEGQAVVVHVFEVAGQPGARRVVTVAEADCSTIDDRIVPG